MSDEELGGERNRRETLGNLEAFAHFGTTAT